MYTTINELNNFEFEEAFVDDIRFMNGSFYMELENVKIKPENTCNHDIRVMRTNDMKLIIKEAKITSIIKEGYKVYDADEKLIEKVEDVNLDISDIFECFKIFKESTILAVKQENDNYSICIDTEENTYDINVMGTENIQEWTRFINL